MENALLTGRKIPLSRYIPVRPRLTKMGPTIRPGNHFFPLELVGFFTTVYWGATQFYPGFFPMIKLYSI